MTEEAVGRNGSVAPRVEGASAVAVIGAGPAGCAAGIVLARSGLDVCVIDAAVFPRDKICGDALSSGSIRLLDELGAGDRVRAAPHAVVDRAAAVFPDGTRIERRYDDPGLIVRRLDLDDALRRTLEASGARLLQGYRVGDLLRDGDRVVGVAGPELRWSAPIVIAADGYGSRALDPPGPGPARGPWLGLAATEYWRGVDFPFGAGTCDHCFDEDLPLGYGWIFPAVDGLSNVGVFLRSDTYARKGRRLGDLFDAFLERHAARFRGGERVGRRRAWSLPIAPRPMPVATPGLLVCGDAAGFIDPFTGEGIWQALRTGISAGETARDAVRAGGLGARLLGRYARECDGLIARPSRRRLVLQHALRAVVRGGLYRSPLVRAALRAGYQRRATEITRSATDGSARDSQAARGHF